MEANKAAVSALLTAMDQDRQAIRSQLLANTCREIVMLRRLCLNHAVPDDAQGLTVLADPRPSVHYASTIHRIQ